MTFVTTRGARFHTVELGHDGPPVVMLHGLFTGSLASWYFTAAPAVATAHRVRLIDWRGHGLSDRTRSGYTSAAMAEDLAELTADLPEFAVVGHSFGGLVAVRFALANPGRLTRIALVDPPLAPGPSPLDRLGAPATGALGRFAGLALGRLSRFGDLIPGPMDPLLAETTVLADLAAEPPLTDDDLAALPAVPLLVVAGSRSPFRGALDRIGRVRPDADRRELPGGHDVHVTAKRALGTLLTEFLDG
jgi:pimeloyl-ACP methyl ester carboxylesterase